MFERFRSWLNGTFTCRKCGRTVHLMSFGVGEIICNGCYDGEQPHIFPDKYWLNRFIFRN